MLGFFPRLAASESSHFHSASDQRALGVKMLTKRPGFHKHAQIYIEPRKDAGGKKEGKNCLPSRMSEVLETGR